MDQQSSQADAFSLRDEYIQCRDWTRRAVTAAYKSAEAYVKSESAYQEAKFKATAQMKADGETNTFMQMTVKGHPSVIGHLFERNMAEVMHRVDLKVIDVAAQQEREAFKEYENAMRGL